jgi:hypothetical protein
MATQELKSKFYRVMHFGNQPVYLFKEVEYWDGEDRGTMFIRATKDREGERFLVESGAGISEKRMESQIVRYFNNKLKKQGYIY